MGQYHITVNLDKKEFINPHKLGDGLKLWEQLNSEAGTMCALHILLACSNGRGGGDIPEHELVGRWAGDRIAIVGDYAEDDDLLPEDIASTIYDRCNDDEFKDISDEILPLIENICDVKITGDGWRNKTRKVALRPDIILKV